MRLLLFTGKGGVGKTTLAAATAVRLADSGRRALVVSTDPAHSLADAFGARLTGDPSEVDYLLSAAHIDARALVDRSWSSLRSGARSLFGRLGLDAIDAEELSVLPGVDDLLALSEVVRLAAGPWDAVVVDCGPTAETLRLLALPEAAAGYLRRFGELRELAAKMASLRAVLADPAVTGVRLVLTPERLVVAETRRTLTALTLKGIRVEALIANRLVPRARRWSGPAANWLRVRRSEQDSVLSDLDSMSLPVRVVEHRATEPIGLPALREVAAELYGDGDPLDAPAEPTRLLSITADGEDHLLAIAFPLTDHATLDLARVGDDLAITTDGVRRLIALPLMLRRHTVTDAEATKTGIVLRFTPGGEERP
ncbi:TRC40/GET3/ArsA family transport-energizing ATPase [Actinokineospora sp. 24-640]